TESRFCVAVSSPFFLRFANTHGFEASMKTLHAMTKSHDCSIPVETRWLSMYSRHVGTKLICQPGNVGSIGITNSSSGGASKSPGTENKYGLFFTPSLSRYFAAMFSDR